MLYRICHEERLAERKRGGQKRSVGARAPIVILQGANQCCSLHFASDSMPCGRRFWVICVINNFNLECPPTVVETSISGIRVAGELDRVA